MKRMALIAAAVMIGCGRWPPVVQDAADLSRLPSDTTSIRARSLPDSDIPALRRFRNLRILDFFGGNAVKQAQLTDEGLRNLSALELPSLHMLHVGPNKNITDAGLQHLVKLKTLDYLGLALCNQITDACLETVATMTYLGGLDLRGNAGLTDKGLVHLASMQNLKSLSLDGCTHISAAAVQQLRLSLPGCKVRKDDASWDYQMRGAR
jgi:hypothetical protein